MIFEKDMVEDETEDISSTEIRRRIEEKIAFDDLMHPEAAKYLLSLSSSPSSS